MKIEPTDFKYVVRMSRGAEVPNWFPQSLRHIETVQEDTIVVSAGFCRLESRGNWRRVIAFGDSESLHRESRGEIDAKLIERYGAGWI